MMKNEQPEPLCLWTGKVIPKTEVARRRPSPLAQLNYLFLTPVDDEEKISQTCVWFNDGSSVLKHFPGIVRIKQLIGHLAIGFDQDDTPFLLNARTGTMLRKS